MLEWMAERSCPGLLRRGSLGVFEGFRLFFRAVVSLVHVSVLLLAHSPDCTSQSVSPSWDTATEKK